MEFTTAGRGVNVFLLILLGLNTQYISAKYVGLYSIRCGSVPADVGGTSNSSPPATTRVLSAATP